MPGARTVPLRPCQDVELHGRTSMWRSTGLLPDQRPFGWRSHRCPCKHGVSRPASQLLRGLLMLGPLMLGPYYNCCETSVRDYGGLDLDFQGQMEGKPYCCSDPPSPDASDPRRTCFVIPLRGPKTVLGRRQARPPLLKPLRQAVSMRQHMKMSQTTCPFLLSCCLDVSWPFMPAGVSTLVLITA